MAVYLCSYKFKHEKEVHILIDGSTEHFENISARAEAGTYFSGGRATSATPAVACPAVS